MKTTVWHHVALRAFMLLVLTAPGGHALANLPLLSDLIDAAASGRVGLVREYLAEGTDVNGIDDSHRTALTEACLRGHRRVVQVLIEAGADPDLKGAKQLRPILAASVFRQYYVARILIDEGANTNVRDVRGWTPLHHAANLGDLRLASLLIRNDVPLDAINKHERTAFMYAVERGNIQMVKLLLLAGVNLTRIDAQHQSALDIAIERGHDVIRDLIRSDLAQVIQVMNPDASR